MFFAKSFTTLIWKIEFGADQDIPSGIDITAGDGQGNGKKAENSFPPKFCSLS